LPWEGAKAWVCRGVRRVIDRRDREVEAWAAPPSETLLTVHGLQPAHTRADRPRMDAQLDLLHPAAANDKDGGSPSDVA
jgi:hypothetical protein